MGAKGKKYVQSPVSFEWEDCRARVFRVSGVFALEGLTASGFLPRFPPGGPFRIQQGTQNPNFRQQRPIFPGLGARHMEILPKVGVPSWGAAYQGILLFGGLYEGPFIFANSHMKKVFRNPKS